MSAGKRLSNNGGWPKLAHFPQPAKALVTATMVVMGIGLLGALGQVVVHDIIPTFFSEDASAGQMETEAARDDRPRDADVESSVPERGDLFSELEVQKRAPAEESFYKDEQFVWLLRWSHIHLFGMNMIFIFMGVIAIFLSMSQRTRTWLVVLPFLGVLIDITAMWLKAYISPIFFWLHVPGGGLLMVSYLIVFFCALREMWSRRSVL